MFRREETRAFRERLRVIVYALSAGVRKKAPVRPGRLLDCFWNARAGVMRADDQTDPSRMKSDVIYLRLSEMLDSTVSILRETAKA